MTRQLWIADKLRAYGLTVVEVTGWQDRARPGAFDPVGVLIHHTAGPQGKDAPSLQVCIDGRSDLPGPLCNVMLARNCTCYVISAGRCNHAGAGAWGTITDGNRHFLGIEAENDGVGEPWAPDMLDAFHRATAALCHAHNIAGLGAVIAHREWAPTRKTDPKGIDMDAFRAAVGAAMRGHTVPTNPPSATEAALIEQWQQMLLDNGAPIGNKDGRFGRLTLEHSRKVLDHRNQLLAQVAKLEASLLEANNAGASCMTELVAARAEVKRVAELYDGPAVQATVRDAMATMDAAKAKLQGLA